NRFRNRRNTASSVAKNEFATTKKGMLGSSASQVSAGGAGHETGYVHPYNPYVENNPMNPQAGYQAAPGEFRESKNPHIRAAFEKHASDLDKHEKHAHHMNQTRQNAAIAGYEGTTQNIHPGMLGS